MFCLECNKPIEPDSKLCPYCGTNLEESITESVKSPKVLINERIRRKSYFWKLNLIGALMAAFSLVLPYIYYHSQVLILYPDPDFYGWTWLWGLGINFNESEGFKFFFSFPPYSINYNALIITIIFVSIVYIMFMIAIREKTSGDYNVKNLRKGDIILIILGIVLIVSNIFQLFDMIPVQYPTITTEFFPVGAISAFFAAGIAIFSGTLGLRKR